MAQITALNTGPRATVDDLLPSWTRHLRAENKASKTLSTYLASAEGFLAFLKAHKLPTEAGAIRREHIEEFVVDSLSRHKASTASIQYRSLQQFFKWLVQVEGELAVSPMVNMRPPAVQPPEERVLRAPELKALLRTCERGQGFRDRRDYAILRVFVDTGARLNEVSSLRYSEDPDESDVDLDRGILRLRVTKNRKPRLASIGAKTIRALDRYLRVRRQHKDAKTSALWLSTTARGGMTSSGVAQAVKTRAEEAKVRLHVHQLRHTWNHMADEAGMSETARMKLAGWSSRAMLDRYASGTANERALAEHKRLELAEGL